MGDASGAAWAAHTGPAQHTWRSLLVTHCWAGLGWAGLGWLDAAPTSPHQNHGLCCRGAAAVPPSPVTGHWAAGGCRRGWVCAVLCPLCPLCPLRPGLNKTEQCGEHRQQAGPTQRTWPGPPLLPGLDWLYSSAHRHQHQVTRQSEDSGQWPVGDTANIHTLHRGHGDQYQWSVSHVTTRSPAATSNCSDNWPHCRYVDM